MAAGTVTFTEESLTAALHKGLKYIGTSANGTVVTLECIATDTERWRYKTNSLTGAFENFGEAATKELAGAAALASAGIVDEAVNLLWQRLT